MTTQSHTEKCMTFLISQKDYDEAALFVKDLMPPFYFNPVKWIQASEINCLLIKHLSTVDHAKL